MNGISLFEVIDLLPKAGIFLTPVAAAMGTYVVCEVLRIPTNTQWLATGIVFFGTLLVIVTIWLFRKMFLKKKGGLLEEGLAGDSGDTAALRAQWKDSVKKLKGTAVGGGGSRALAALPWFVIIGAPASGKSTLLRQSGIDFPVGDAAIRGLQGTRNCDWWFSNVGVFLDTAGRYISDASASEWAEFLGLVRDHRTGAPINGVIVALPAPDLLSRSEAARELDARRLRARLDELIDHLGVNFPVWIVLTKVDLIGGFAEFYGHADAATRSQIIGWTADQGEGGRFDLGAFGKRFKAMIHRLREMRPALLATAPLRDRPAAFAFPDEFAEVEEPLSRMLARLFEPNVFQETPLFRGLYVTSATQQGSPLQRAASRIRELLGAPQVDADASGSVVKHAYFVKDLMHERIVADQSMTWTTQIELERNKNRRRGINMMGASVGVLLLLTVIAFGLKATKELEAVEAEIEMVGTSRSGGVDRCEALREAAMLASPDNLKNLGLSQQRSLREDAGVRQSLVYQGQVLQPLLVGWAEELRSADTTNGVDDLVAIYEDFLTVHALLDRATDSTAMPPDFVADEVDDEGDADDAADGADAEASERGARPPDGYFTDAERAALESRSEMLRRNHVIAKKRKNRPDPIDTMLDVIWHNHGCAAWFEDDGLRLADLRAGRVTGVPASARPKACHAEIVPLVQDVHDAFRDALSRYVERSATAIDGIKDVQATRAETLEARLELLRTVSVEVRVELLSAAFTRDELEDYLDSLTDAAAGMSAGGVASVGAAGASGPPGNVNGAVARIRALLDRPGGPPPGLSSPIARFEVLEDWEAGGPGDSGETGAKLKALSKLSALLAAQRARLGTTEFLGLEFRLPAKKADKGDMEAALNLLRSGEDAAAAEWLAAVRANLAILADQTVADYASDEGRWGLGVEQIVPTLLRDALFREFFDKSGRGRYPRIARDLIRDVEDTGRFDRDTTADALEMLLRPHEDGRGTDSERPLTEETLQIALDAAAAEFKGLLEATQVHWDALCDGVKLYGSGNAWAYLDKWRGATSALRVAFKSGWDDWSLPRELNRSAAARAIWSGQTAPGAISVESLQQRYSFYGAGYDVVQGSLSSLVGLEKAKVPEDLKAIAEGLGAQSMAPEWSNIGAGSASEPGESSLTELRAAVRKAEDDLVSRVQEYFEIRWAELRPTLLQALSSADADQMRKAEKQLGELLAEMRPFFGPELNYQPGKRLKVSTGFPRNWSAASGGTFVPRAFSFTLRPQTVPFVELGSDVYPSIRVIYESKGGEPAQWTWKPHQPQQLDVDWIPGKGMSFKIWMVGDDPSKKRLFREWEGDRAVLSAIEDGGGVGETLVWEGRDDFIGVTATFFFDSADKQAIRNMLSPPTTGAKLSLPDTCVQRMERP